jgi:hypothetical protein
MRKQFWLNTLGINHIAGMNCACVFQMRHALQLFALLVLPTQGLSALSGSATEFIAKAGVNVKLAGRSGDCQPQAFTLFSSSWNTLSRWE